MPHPSVHPPIHPCLHYSPSQPTPDSSSTHTHTYSISLSGFNAQNVDYVAQAFTTILSTNPPAPATTTTTAQPLPADAAKEKGCGGESPMVLVQPQQPHQVLP